MYHRSRGASGAFNHDKAEGLTVLLETLPIGRKVVLLPPRDDDTLPK